MSQTTVELSLPDSQEPPPTTSEDPLPLEDPLPVVDALDERCACCPALKQCVQLRVRGRVDSRGNKLEDRIFPMLGERSEHPHSVRGMLRKSLSSAQREFVAENFGNVRCLQDGERAAVEAAIRDVQLELRTPKPSISSAIRIDAKPPIDESNWTPPAPRTALEELGVSLANYYRDMRTIFVGGPAPRKRSLS